MEGRKEGRKEEGNIITHKKSLSLLRRKSPCSPEEGPENAENTGKRHVRRQGPSQRVLESFLRLSEVP